MKRLTKKEKLNISSMIKEGVSLNEISRITQRNKSTLYHYYKKISNKRLKDVEINKDNQMFIGELLGLFVGDGYCFHDKKGGHYSTRFFFNNSEKGYVNQIIKLFHENFNKKPALNRSLNVLVVRYYSKKLFNFLLNNTKWEVSRNKLGYIKKSRTISLRNKKFSKDFKKGFLRGFLDSDGYLSNKKVVFSSASELIIKQTNQFLNDLSFEEHRLSFYKDKRPNRVGMWHLYIPKKEHLKLFRLVQPRNLISWNKDMHQPGLEFSN